MGRKNQSKLKPNGQVATQPQGPPVTMQAHQLGQREIDQKQNQKIDWALRVSIFSAVVSVAGVFVTVAGVYWTYRATQAADRQATEAATANKLTQAGIDRSAGKVRAKFEHVTDKEEFVRQVKPYMRKVVLEGVQHEVFRLDDIDDLLRWAPHISIKNTGEEIIDGVKVEVNCVHSGAYGPGVTQILPKPIVVSSASVAEITAFGKLMPQKTMRVVFLPQLLEQIRQADFGAYSDQDHEGVFEVRILCRIVGASNYDQKEPNGGTLLHFHWKPTGFKDEKRINDFMKLKPHVTLD